MVCLESLECMLQHGKTQAETRGTENRVVEVLMAADGAVDALEHLQEHPNHSIYEKVGEAARRAGDDCSRDPDRACCCVRVRGRW